MNKQPYPSYSRLQSLLCVLVPLCVVVTGVLWTAPASAQTASSDEARLQQIERQIAALQAEVRATRERMSEQAGSRVQPPAEGTRRYDGKDSKAVLPAPQPEEVCNWTGFYIGLNAGAAVYEPRITDRDYYEGNDTRTFEDIAFIGGGQVGYNWQINNLVLGLEVDGSGTNADVHVVNDFGGGRPPFEFDNAKIDFLGTARVRVGVVFQNALVYVTGGGAYAHGDWSHSYAIDVWKPDDWRWGITGGVGLEYMLNCRWSLRAETLYTHLQDEVTHGTGSPSIVPLKYQFGDDLWTLRLGLNYKFRGFFSH